MRIQIFGIRRRTRIEKLRRKIDLVDEQLLTVLSNRMGLVRQVGEYKNKKGLPSLDEARWQKVLETRTGQGRLLGLSEKLIKKVFTAIHEDALRIEDNIGGKER